MDTEALVEGTLRSYLRILFNRKWSVLIVLVLTVVAAFVYTHHEPKIYQSSAELYLAPTAAQMAIGGGTFTYDQSSVPDQVEILQGNGVAAVVKQKLGYAPGISGSEVGQTDVMDVTATSESPTLAAKIANTYATAYTQYIQQTTIASLQSANQTLENELTKVQQKLSAAQAQLAAAAPNSTQATQFQDTVSSLQSQQNVLTQEASDLAQHTELNASAAQLIASATPPSAPSSPDLKSNLLFGLIAGLALGIGFVVAREYFDDTIRSEEELHLALARSEKTSKTLVLGAIPFGEEVLPGAVSDGVVSITDPTSPQAEAYRELRTSLQFLQVREPIEAVLVSSPSGGEGKSTTLANLGVMLAKTGKSVVMVSCDLRRPRLYEYFGLSNRVGFTSVLVGDASLNDAIVPVPGSDGLAIIPPGPLPPNPAELLASPAAEDLIAKLKSRFDVVLIDSPPVLRVTDAAVISTLCDTTLVVVRAGLTTRRDMVKSLDIFDRIGSPIAGVVVNALPTELTYKDRYYYSPQESIDYGLEHALTGNGNGNGNGNGHGNGNGASKRPVAAGVRRDDIDLEEEAEEDLLPPRRSSQRLTFADDDPVAPEEPPAAPPRSRPGDRPSSSRGPVAGRRPPPPQRGMIDKLLRPPPKKKRPPSGR